MSKRIPKSTVPTIYLIDAADGFNSAEAIEMAEVLEVSNSAEVLTITEDNESFLNSNTPIQSSPKVETQFQLDSPPKIAKQIQILQLKQELKSSTKTIIEAIDEHHIFTLLYGHTRNWTEKVCQLKGGGFKSCLEIEVGNADGTISILIVWGDGGKNVLINWVLSYFR